MQRPGLNSLAVVFVTFLSSNWTLGQTLKLRPAEQQHPANPVQITTGAPLLTVPMSVSAGSPIKVALDSEVRVKTVGQLIHGRTTDPVYAFDKLLIPAGTAVNGKITAIDGVPKAVRVQNALNANFSPVHDVHLQFDELVMADGRRVPIQTVASPAPNEILQFVSPNEKEQKKKKPAETAATEMNEAKHEIKRQVTKQVNQRWNNLKRQVREPVKTLKNYALAQSPIHRQYLHAGTSFNADLLQPLDFGREMLKPEALTSVGAPPPSGCLVRARLVTALNSSSTKKGAPVEAVITEPLVVADRLILPEGSVIKGSVVQVQPARRLGRNGQLRIIFHEVAPPNGIAQKVEASLEAVAVAKDAHLKLDAEGGAQVTTPRTRYLTTGVAVALAAGGYGDRDAGEAGQSVGEATQGAAQGASGFRLVGTMLSLTARSAAFSATLGAYGAASSIYYHFLARGRDVVYPKDMAMIIGLGTRDSKPKQQQIPALTIPPSQAPVESAAAATGSVSSF